MTTSRPSAYALAICASVSMGAMCSAAPVVQHSVVPPSVQSRAFVQRPDRNHSWMRQTPPSAALLYVGDETTNDVYVYSPQGVLTGTLTGFSTPQGICTDARQNVYITNFYDGETIVYAHGGTTPLATLNDPGEYIDDCASDPQTGKVAVANFRDMHSGPGSVSVFTSRALPTVYSNPNILISVVSLCYDDTGNLFIDGYNPSGNFALAEIAKGGTKLERINSSVNVSTPGALRFDGNYPVVGDATGSVAYQLQISGQTATVAGTTPLNGATASFGLAVVGSHQGVQGTALIATNADPQAVFEYPYPAGGSPSRTLSSFTFPVGVALSL